MQTDQERLLFASTSLFLSPDVSLMTASSTVNGVFLAPFTGYVTEVSYAFGEGAGTSHGVAALALKRSTVNLVTVAANTVDDTVMTSGEVSVFVSAGETLTVAVTLGHTDNALTGFTIQVRMRHILSTD